MTVPLRTEEVRCIVRMLQRRIRRFESYRRSAVRSKDVMAEFEWRVAKETTEQILRGVRRIA